MASILPISNGLRNPGELVDNIYYSESSLQQTSARVLNKESYVYPFNSLSLGTVQTLVIQKNLMPTHVLAVYEFDPSVSMTSGYFLSQGWGFLLTQRIEMQYGGSEVLQITGNENFLRSMNECESDYK